MSALLIPSFCLTLLNRRALPQIGLNFENSSCYPVAEKEDKDMESAL